MAFKVFTAAMLFGLLLTVFPGDARADHGLGPWGRLVDWRSQQIEQVLTFGGFGQKVSVEGKECLSGGVLAFRVRDDFAFDIDETVWLDVDFYLSSADSNGQVNVSYDRNDAAPGWWWGGGKSLQLPKGANSHWYRQSIPLERARFANLGFEGSDFTLSAAFDFTTLPARQFTVCNLTLRRSYTTPVHKSFGWAAIEVVDEHGQLTPARMGLYDSSGRLPLPSDDALTLKLPLIEATRVVGLGSGVRPWPVKNRSAFYAPGRYRTRLPVGNYDLTVVKGPEYRLARQRLTIRAGETTSIMVRPQRWANMAAKGWYSGDGHVHYARNSADDDRTLQLLTRAEDLRVANILEFDNSAQTYLAHYDWKPIVFTDRDATFVLAPGQEAPRTTRFGHTVQLNIKHPIRDTAHYLLYHKVFEEVHAQGGLAGYAHAIGSEEKYKGNAVTFGVRGMATDVPFGLVDIAEIMIGCTETGVSIWFDFLNLGYKLSPTAGSDYPMCGAPGSVRNYVQVYQRFTPQAWFDALKQGRTFVTSGPMLELSINGQGMGSEIHVRSGEPLLIQAKASLNPDIDALSSLELIEQGDTIKVIASQQGATELALRHELRAGHGSWFVVRARGKDPNVIAMSAPIYVLMDDQSFWKPAAVEAIATKMKSRMQDIFREDQLETTDGAEVFAKHWDAQKSALKTRVDRAVALYDDLIRRAALANRP